MTFQDRFKGRTSVLTKDGIKGLISIREIPVKDPATLSFSRSANPNTRNLTESSYTLNETPLPNTSNTMNTMSSPKRFANNRLRQLNTEIKEEFQPQQPFLRSSDPFNIPMGPEQLMYASHQNRSASLTDRRQSSNDPARFPPVLRSHGVSFEVNPDYRDYRDNKELHQMSSFNPQRRETSLNMSNSKLVMFQGDRQESKEDLSAVQRKYREILRGQKSETKLFKDFSIGETEKTEPGNRDMERRYSYNNNNVHRKAGDIGLKQVKSYSEMAKSQGANGKVYNRILEGKLEEEADRIRMSLVKNGLGGVRKGSVQRKDSKEMTQMRNLVWTGLKERSAYAAGKM